MNPLIYVTFGFAVILACIALYFWLRRKSSKGRFAISIASAIVSVFTMTIGVLSQVNVILALVRLLSGDSFSAAFKAATPTWWWIMIVVAFASFCALLLAKFGKDAIRNWDGPITQTVFELHENGLDNNLSALAWAQLRNIVTQKVDPPVMSSSSGDGNLPEPPTAPSWRALAPALLQIYDRPLYRTKKISY